MVRLLKPLQPQTPGRVFWEQRLVERLSERMECDHGDVCAFLEAHPTEVDELYFANANPRSAAEVLFCMD